jgi:flagellar basal body-associated protein FliL
VVEGAASDVVVARVVVLVVAATVVVVVVSSTGSTARVDDEAAFGAGSAQPATIRANVNKTRWREPDLTLPLSNHSQTT